MADSDEMSDDFESDDSLEDAPEIEASPESSQGMLQKERERLKIQADIEAFLAKGGTIHSVENSVVADPPRKPQSSYGSQPIL